MKIIVKKAIGIIDKSHKAQKVSVLKFDKNGDFHQLSNHGKYPELSFGAIGRHWDKQAKEFAHDI